MTKRTIGTGLFLLAAALILSAPSPAQAAPAAPEKKGSESPDTAEVKIYSQGLETGAKKAVQFKRVAVLFPQAVAFVYLFGFQDRVVGMPISKLSVSMHEGGFFKSVDPGLLSKKDVGFPGKPNVETIIALDPDLIVEPSFHLKAGPALDKLKFTRFRVFGTFASVEEWLAAANEFGKTVGCEAAAKKYADYFDGKLKFIADRIAGVKSDKKLKVVHIIKSGDRLVTHGRKSSFVLDMLKKLGTEPFGYGDVAAPEYFLSKEEVLKFDPDFIFLEEINHSAFKNTIATEDAFWKQLKAYKNNAIYHVPVDDESCFLTGWYFNVAAPLGMLWTVKILYPEAFRDVDTDGEAREFYREFFRIDVEKMRGANKNIGSSK